MRCSRHAVLVWLILTLSRPLILSAWATHNGQSPITTDSVISRLARADSFAFGGIGFALAPSQGETDYRIILSRPSAAVDFDRVFTIGNVQAKCYALVGLRQVDPRRFELLAANSRSSRTQVAVTRGCATFEYPLAEIVDRIRAGVYSGPATHELIPAPRITKTPTSHEESWITRVLRAFSPSTSPLPDAPPPRPAPPPPPGWRSSK
jgi:hypothetical protein